MVAHKNRVVRSFNFEGATRCVDVFQRPDGTFGFEEFRREPEDGRGWFPIGYFAEQRFASYDEALSEAKAKVGWLSASLRS